MRNGKTMGPVSVDSLGNNVQEVLDDATERVKEVAELGDEKLQAARSMFDGAWKSAQTRAIEAKNAAMARAKVSVDTADGYVRHSPWKALGLAAGVGVLAGLLLARR